MESLDFDKISAWIPYLKWNVSLTTPLNRLEEHKMNSLKKIYIALQNIENKTTLYLGN